jgi:RNA polymerase sigma factor (sigma-70 family)
MLRDAARTSPDRAAIVQGDKRISYEAGKMNDAVTTSPLSDPSEGWDDTAKERSFADLRSTEQLVAACRAGEVSAWEGLLRRYQRLIYTVPLRFRLDEEEAADIFQQTCLRLFEHLHTLDNPRRLDAWLVSTSRRLCLDALRNRRRHGVVDRQESLPDRMDEAPLPDEGLAELEEQQRIRRAVARLDPRCRALVYHLFYNPDDPPYRAIASALGLSQGSVGPTRARCFSRLKVLLQEEEP